MADRMGLLAAAAAVMTLAGCAGPIAGPEPARGSSSVELSAQALPPRPQVVDLAEVDPCSLLTEQQQDQLGIDAPAQLSEPDRYGNPRCNFSKVQSNPRYGYQLVGITQEDVSMFLTGNRPVSAEVVSAAEFPAVAYRRPTDDRGCFVGVSTKQGQYLNVQYSEGSGSDDTSAVACEKARVAAAMATRTLLARR